MSEALNKPGTLIEVKFGAFDRAGYAPGSVRRLLIGDVSECGDDGQYCRFSEDDLVIRYRQEVNMEAVRDE